MLLSRSQPVSITLILSWNLIADSSELRIIKILLDTQILTSVVLVMTSYPQRNIYRFIRCLDCQWTRGDPATLANANSPLVNEMKRKIGLLKEKGLSDAEVITEFQYVYGKHVILPNYSP